MQMLKPITIRLPVTLDAQLRRDKAASGMSKSMLIRLALIAYYEKWEYVWNK